VLSATVASLGPVIKDARDSNGEPPGDDDTP
jgi:hypothetical protein